MQNAKILWQSDDVTLARGLRNGGEWYEIRNDRTGRIDSTSVSSLAQRMYREQVSQNAAAAAAPAQIESPLPAAERSSSGLARGATLTMPTPAQYNHMRVALKWCSAQFGRPPVLHRYRGCNITMLKSMARRGWVELDHPIRPSYGTLTDSGRKALARYEAKHGTPAGAR